MPDRCPICRSEAEIELKHPDSSAKTLYGVKCKNKKCRLNICNWYIDDFWFETKEEAEENWKHLLSGSSTDGYHSFDELYHHRTILFASLVNAMKHIDPTYDIDPTCVFKSKQHYEGDMYPGYFIAGILTPDGWSTYHQDVKYWNNFHCRVTDKAPKWDGHTPSQAIARIEKEFAHGQEKD